MPTIAAIETALPTTRFSTEALIDKAGERFSPELQKMVRRFGIDNRRSLLTNYDEVLFSGSDPIWSERGTAMGARAARKCLASAPQSAKDIGLVIGVTSTPSRILPGFVSDLFAEMMELPREVMNLSLQGQGCSPLLKAVEAARWYLASQPDRSVLVVCMESPTPMSQPLEEPLYQAFTETNSWEARQKTVDVVHALLFADSAVAMLLEAHGEGPSFGPMTHLTNERATDRELGHIIGAASDAPSINGRPLYVLGPDIPERGAFYAANTVQRLLALDDCPIRTPREASQVLVHTGSKKILNDLAATLDVDHAAMQPSFDVLTDHGNLIGASIGMMLYEALPAASGDILMATFGLSFSASAGMLHVPDGWGAQRAGRTLN